MIDIVGTETNENGRSCHAHEVCGEQLVPGSKVRIRRETYISPTTGDEEDSLVAYVVGDGVMTCKVGFCRGISPFVGRTITTVCMLAWWRFIRRDHGTSQSARSATATLDAVWTVAKTLGNAPVRSL
jgi:hypothetical protein